MEHNDLSFSNEEITRNFDLVNQFNENFYCASVNNILGLFKKDKNIWQHPLILNNHYCLLCKEFGLNKLSLYHLQSTHLNDNPYDCFKKKGIKLRFLHRAKRRLKRRFVHSQDNASQFNIERLFNHQYEDSFSDSDLMFISKKKTLNNNTISVNDRTNLSTEIMASNKREHKKASSRFSVQEQTQIFQRNMRTQRRNTCSEKNPIKESNQINIITNGNDNDDIENEAAAKYKKDIGILCPKKKDSKISIIKMFKKILSMDNKKKKPKEERQKVDSTVSSQKNIINDMAQEMNNRNEDNMNENCDICLQEIKDKYILGCGDFYCKECLRGIILNGLKDISQINKLSCPKEICKEPIDSRVIEKLLTEKEYSRYERLQVRVEGLMNRSLIPCPYPDCEHYGKESAIKRNILSCGDEHLFCVKCLETLCSDELSVKDHTCIKKTDETIKYLSKNKLIKKCPNCRTWVTRERGGCNNMTCLNPWCNYEFCWICDGLYENTHYKNPFSICFGLSESDHESKFSRYKSIRVLKCLVIFLLLIFIILPIVMLLFSFVVVGLYVVSFVLDGSAMKNIKLKNKYLNTFFYFLVYMFYVSLSIASIPLGYIAICLLILSPPVVCIIKRCKRVNEEERI